MKEMKTTAQVLVDCLEAEGVDVMFGIPGEETLDLMFAIRDSKIRFIPVRHEQGAAFMADVYGRLTGRAGVCLSTLGPGATNLVTGVADAYLDGAPLVAITGQVGTDRMQLTSHQYLDLTAMFEPITKRSKQIIRPDTVGEIVRLAFKHAEKGKPGATHIDLPQNIAKMPADAVPLKRQQMHEVYADPTHIAAAGKIISEAKNPVILAGAGAVRGHAAAAVTELADRLHIPVVNTMMAKGIIPMDDKYSLLTIGIPQKDYVNQLFDRADVVIAIGYDIVECAPAKWGARENMTIVHIDSAPADVNKRYQPAVEVVGDISESLYEILRCAHRTGEPEFALALRQTMVAEHEAMAADDSCPMKPARILADVRKVMGRDDIVVSDVGAHKMWIARHLPHLQWLRQHGLLHPGRVRGKASLSGEESAGGLRRRRLHDEQSGAGNSGAGACAFCDPHLGGFQLRPHQVERAGAVRRRALLCGLFESRFQAAGRGYALQGLSC